ncbi:MAG TPA: hypothetical protein VHM28_07555 [Anaerolineales bacterium]|nr:hypothetical protein [Anaerolineales bacterium]
METEAFRSRNFLVVSVLIFIVGGLAYLPLVNKLGYYNDDWYLLYAGHTQGSQIFHTIYSEDRPARAFVLSADYALFGDHVIYYHLTAYLFRVLAGISFFWILTMLWPRKQSASTLSAILFLVYPGFLSQYNSIDYQSQLLSLFLAMISIALTVKAIQTLSPFIKVGLIVLSILTGWFYLALVEYFFGLEVFRFICIFLLIHQKQTGKWAQNILPSVRAWAFSAAIPAGFFAWRFFAFQSGRKATDLSAQFTAFQDSPLATVFWQVIHLVQDSISVIVLAWGMPLSQFANSLRLSSFLTAIAIGIAIIATCYWGIKHIGAPEDEVSDPWSIQWIVVGSLSVAASLMPVLLANRRVFFPEFSRYALAGSLGSALVLVGLIYLIKSEIIQHTLVAFLLISAAYVHFANASQAAAETAEMNSFWWQVSWRAPAIQAGTTLIADYASIPIQEDYFVWAPANLVYYPTADQRGKMNPKLYAAVLTNSTVLDIAQGGSTTYTNRRGIVTQADTSQILVLSQPTTDSCLHIIEGYQPEFSSQENSQIRLIAEHSSTNFVLANAEPRTPPSIIFGKEPEHDWCYYYEKASLARQRGNWQEIVQLAQEAKQKNLTPTDNVEWLPFLQADVVLNEEQSIRDVAKIMKKDDYQRWQACHLLRQTSYPNYQPNAQALSLFQTLFCQ